MLAFSRVIYITLLFLLYSDCAFIRSIFSRKPNMCSKYDSKGYCTKEYYPVCASDGETYGNRCTFCIAHRKSGGSITFIRNGEC
ncbi:ovomucoid-like [Mesocricetus auratus]|uniref:Ovomucoid-like n=1 Tax=Mesocricetus auratus TaxID=10036 RepID=A0A1U7QJT4_MESAU|nr:ovomucoid-like [Mesocricetus auratus]